MRLIFDADPVVYAAGFAAESHAWDAVFERADGELIDMHFEPDPKKGGAKEQLNAYQKLHDLDLVIAERVVTPEPLAHCLHSVGRMIRGSMEAVANEYGLHVDDLNVTVILSGPGNWRETHAKIRPYKGNRDPEHKPYWYAQIREYLVTRWGAQVIHGHEADDEASILAAQHRQDGDDDGYVICTIDKDLDQIPGRHYDYKKHVHYQVNVEEAERWFWVQTLCGDVTDNIPGCYKFGTAKAEKFVDDVNGQYDHLPLRSRELAGTRSRWLWQNIVKAYDDAQAKYGEKVPWFGKMTPEAAALETAQLVHMQTETGVLWTPPS